MPILTTPSTTPSAASALLGLSARLKKCKDTGKLTTADLATLLGRPFPTVRMWLNGFTLPSGPRAASIWPKLTRIEKMIDGHHGLPVPDSVGHFERPAYISRLVNGRARLSGPSAAKRKRRVAVRVRKGARKKRA